MTIAQKASLLPSLNLYSLQASESLNSIVLWLSLSKHPTWSISTSELNHWVSTFLKFIAMLPWHMQDFYIWKTTSLLFGQPHTCRANMEETMIEVGNNIWVVVALISYFSWQPNRQSFYQRWIILTKNYMLKPIDDQKDGFQPQPKTSGQQPK